MNVENKKPVSPLIPLLYFTAALVFGFVVLPLLARGDFADLTSNSAYRTWQILIVLQAFLWFFGSLYAIGAWYRESPGYPSPLTITVILLLGFLTFLPYLIVWLFRPFEAFDWSQSEVTPRYFVASTLGVLSSIIIGAGIVRIHVMANSWLAGRISVAEHLDAYRSISSELEKHILLLGGILAGAVIGTKASREAVFMIDCVYPFPAEQVWQLAVYWSALLAILYTASRSSVRRVGRRLRDTLLASELSGQTQATDLKREAELGEYLGINRNYFVELQSVFSVLTPIAGALASELI